MRWTSPSRALSFSMSSETAFSTRARRGRGAPGGVMARSGFGDAVRDAGDRGGVAECLGLKDDSRSRRFRGRDASADRADASCSPASARHLDRYLVLRESGLKSPSSVGAVPGVPGTARFSRSRTRFVRRLVRLPPLGRFRMDEKGVDADGVEPALENFWTQELRRCDDAGGSPGGGGGGGLSRASGSTVVMPSDMPTMPAAL
ncbi:hypothetical protein JL722_149 [Aureococcus anophagefferens]|nr:hypothetical protein JL722_149 [Aureococcus anophagefferens]